MREGEDQWLGDIAPTLTALIMYLTKENNGVKVYEKKNYRNDKDVQYHEMSNGLTYFRNEKGRWDIA